MTARLAPAAQARVEQPVSLTLLARVFSFPTMLAAGLTFLVFWACAPRFDDPDLWWNLKVGETIWNTHRIPAADSFSFTAAGHPWIAHEWLSQWVLYAVYHAGGYPALMLWLCAVASAIVVLTYVLCGLWSENWKVALVGGIAACFFLTVSLSLRPLLLGHLFLVTELLILYYGVVRKSRLIWALPVLLVVWANCHGSFPLGIAIAGCAGLAACVDVSGARFRLRCERALSIRFASVVLLCAAAPFVNPVGPQLAFYPFNVLTAQPDNVGSVAEWAPLDWQDPRGVAVLAVFGLVAWRTSVARRALHIFEWAALLTSAAMAVRHTRMLPIFGFVAAPIICRQLAGYWDRYDARRDLPWANGALIAIAMACCAAVFPDAKDIDQQIAAKKPVAALSYLRQAGLTGRMLNDYEWGGYLMWANPSQPVFIDGRADIYAWTGVLREYGRWALLEEDPAYLLDRYKIEICLIKVSSPMAQALPHLTQWRRVFSDQQSVIFTRSLRVD